MKLSFKDEREIRAFSDKQTLRKFVASDPLHKKHSNKFSREEKNDRSETQICIKKASIGKGIGQNKNFHFSHS